MAIKASATITLFDVVDIESTTWYYLLQSSTASAPVKPTTATPPSNWKTTEPAYTEGSTNTLYTVMKTTYSDGSFEYTPVSKSTSYEAAKTAYNKAVAANNTANNANNKFDNLQIGGRNLALGSKSVDASKDFINDNQFTVTDETYLGCTVVKSNKVGLDGCTVNLTNIIKRNGLVEGDIITFSTWFKTDDTEKHNYYGYYSPTSLTVSDATCFTEIGINKVYNDWTRFVKTIMINDDMMALANANKRIHIRYESDSDASSGKYYYWAATKLELGNKATDWTPAPEDIDGNIEDLNDKTSERFDEVNSSIESAQSSIDTLKNMISHLVTDANGGSLMTQTSNGWTFNMSSITGNLDAIKSAMATMDTNNQATNNALNSLISLVNNIANKTAYITMSTDENGDPCIELGKSDNTFKVRITNTAIDFLEGSTKIAYANNNTFYVEIIIAKKRLQIGEGPGYSWAKRENGNLGLTYITT